MNENFNLIGQKVNSMLDAMVFLKVGQDKIVLQENEITLNGVTFFTFIYTTEGNENWCFAVNASNLKSNQYEQQY